MGCQSDYAAQNDNVLRELLDLEDQLNKVRQEARLFHQFKKRARNSSREQGNNAEDSDSDSDNLENRVLNVARDSLESLYSNQEPQPDRDQRELSFDELADKDGSTFSDFF